jgi:hypothetical protein
VTNKEQIEWLKVALLQMIQINENLSALKLALVEQGLVDLEKLQVAEEKLRIVWKSARDAVVQLGEESGPSLDELLRAFGGPIQ